MTAGQQDALHGRLEGIRHRICRSFRAGICGTLQPADRRDMLREGGYALTASLALVSRPVRVLHRRQRFPERRQVAPVTKRNRPDHVRSPVLVPRIQGDAPHVPLVQVGRQRSFLALEER